MKRIILFTLILLFVFTTTTFAQEWKTYTIMDGNVYDHQDYKFFIDFPINWQIQFTPYGIDTVSPNHFPLFEMIIRPISILNITSDVFTEENEEKITSYIERVLHSKPNMVLKDKLHISIANHDALKVTLNNADKYFILYFIINKDSIYLITYIGLLNNFDADQEIINQILSSIVFLN